MRGWRPSSCPASASSGERPRDRAPGAGVLCRPHPVLPVLHFAARAAGLPLPAQLLGVRHTGHRAPRPSPRRSPGRTPSAALPSAVARRIRSCALMDRRTVLFVVLSAAFLIVWWILFPPQPPPKAPAGAAPSGETAEKTTAAPVSGASASDTPASATAGTATASSVPSLAGVGGPGGARAERPEIPQGARIEAAAEDEVAIDTPLASVHLTNRGARVVSWKLKKYLDDAGHPLELVSNAGRALDHLPLQFLLEDPGATKRMKEGLYSVSREVDREADEDYAE